MSLADRKKALRKAKKAELKKSAQQTTEVVTAAVPGKKGDEDPLGNKYLEGDLLASAMTFVSPLVEFSPNCIKSQVLGASVYLRRRKCFLIRVTL